MKKILKILWMVLIMTLLSLAVSAQHQNPPHHPPGHGLPGDQNPHDTTLGSGLLVLTLMSLTFGAVKTCLHHKKQRHKH